MFLEVVMSEDDCDCGVQYMDQSSKQDIICNQLFDDVQPAENPPMETCDFGDVYEWPDMVTLL